MAGPVPRGQIGANPGGEGQCQRQPLMGTRLAAMGGCRLWSPACAFGKQGQRLSWGNRIQLPLECGVVSLVCPASGWGGCFWPQLPAPAQVLWQAGAPEQGCALPPHVML